MINILIAAFGVVLVLGGFYAMYYGFATPPNILSFFMGLILTVLGALMIIIFGSNINVSELKFKSKGTKEPKPKKEKNVVKPKKVPKAAEIPKQSQIKPNTAKKPKESLIKRLVTDRKDDAKNDEKAVMPKKIEPKRISNDKKPDLSAEKIESPNANKIKPKVAPKEIKPVSKEIKPKVAQKEIKPVTKEKEPVDQETKKIEPKPISKEIKPMQIVKNPLTEDKLQNNRPKFAMGTRAQTARSKDDEDQYVKNRLDRLKENYIKNAKDIENLIEERLDSFKGTLDQIKSESTDPSIIWSFDAGDVQETMQDTILKANNKILMMYPWVRNIDVSVLKRFMETDSKMIIQEASLDDDTSVELLKLLIENNVKIKTMPHVHTVAIVSDEDNGLIISTDPIYESFEVGVIYKDQKSIEEIERMFNEAWKLSQDIDLN